MPARYLPPDLWQRARHILPLDLDPALRSAIMDLVATAFDWGHMEGHERGMTEAYAPVPMMDRTHRVGTAEVRAPHPSSMGPAHRLAPEGETAPVTPIRTPQIGEIGEGIELDRFGTQQLDRAPAEP